jgi:hypothetical protein
VIPTAIVTLRLALFSFHCAGLNIVDKIDERVFL